MSLFALDEYNDAARRVACRWIDARTYELAPSLRLFPRYEVEHVRTARVAMVDGTVERVEPARNQDGGQLDIREAVAGRLGDLQANLEAVAERRASGLVAFWQQQVERGLAEGSIARASGPPTWDSVMDALQTLDLDFSDDGHPRFEVVAGEGSAQLLAALGPRDATQEVRWQQLMARKKEERRARERNRHMA